MNRHRVQIYHYVHARKSTKGIFMFLRRVHKEEENLHFEIRGEAVTEKIRRREYK